MSIKALVFGGGRACVQAITIADARYDAARREVDFIKRFIFPGGFLFRWIFRRQHFH